MKVHTLLSLLCFTTTSKVKRSPRVAANTLCPTPPLPAATTQHENEIILNTDPINNQQFSSFFRFDQAPDAPSTIVDDDTLKLPQVSPKSHFGCQIPFCPMSKGGRHMTAEQLEPYRHIGDPALDDLVEYMASRGFPLKPQDDLLQRKYPRDIQTRIDDFVRYYSEIPDWVDVAQLERGQSVFLRNADAMTATLYHKSLVAGFSIPKIAKVISATAYLAPPSSPEQVSQRLLDTSALVASCMGLGSAPLLPGGEAWRTALHVRILHAKVRRNLLNRQGEHAWDVDEYGIPINQEDMAATLLAFSTNVLDGVEFVGGIAVSKQDQEDYLALWRYIGWVLGVYTSHDDDKTLPYTKTKTTTHTPPLPSLDPCGPGWYEKYPNPLLHSRQLLQSIILHLLEPDASSKIVAHNLLGVGAGTMIGVATKGQTRDKRKKDTRASKASRSPYGFYLRSFHCRCMIGDALADALELPLHPNRFMRWCVQKHGLAIWWTLRLSTWAGRLPITRQVVVGLRLFFLQMYYNHWKTDHATRMAEGVHRNNQQKDDVGTPKKAACPFAAFARGSGQALPTVCPFAMVAEPQ